MITRKPIAAGLRRACPAGQWYGGQMTRSCGILLPVSALPSPYGIGSLGQEAYDFIDFLAGGGQGWWQVLPIGPTSFGDSPYQSFSTFAGNPYFVDVEELISRGLLTRAEAESFDWGGDDGCIDYEKLYLGRFELLERAAERGWEADGREIESFSRKNEYWLRDYALFMALKRHFGMSSWLSWEDEDIRRRRPEAIERYSRLLEKDIRLFTYIQFLFFRQWEGLRAYGKSRGLRIMGDMPIYVALDSADVWSHPEYFLLDAGLRPADAAGVPPDYFSADGQLWGNPLYDWAAMKKDGYSWWLGRLSFAAELYDALRIDHFRGFESFWAVPAGESTAKNGRWIKGPGMDFIGLLPEKFPDMQFIAEDLGDISPQVRQLLRQSGLPGMKVLEFAFDSRELSSYLPHRYEKNCVCYCGTHDNAPLMAWRSEEDPENVDFAVRYLGLNEEEGFNWGIIRGGMSSQAALFIVQMQDYLGLGGESRMNTPGTLGGNWRWRLKKGQLTPELEKKLAELARIYDRRSGAPA